MASGRCLCGTFRYTVEGSFGDVRYCHCSQCRRGNGSAFSANARINRSQWSLEIEDSIPCYLEAVDS